MNLKKIFNLTKTKIILLILLIILILILLGFVVAKFFPSNNLCTLIDCSCELNSNVSELPCNFCTSYEMVFISGIINVIKSCPSQEIILCENNQQVGVRYNENKNNCEYNLRFFRID